jgi:hypothetical protein
VNDKAPDFSAKDQNGKTVSLKNELKNGSGLLNLSVDSSGNASILAPVVKIGQDPTHITIQTSTALTTVYSSVIKLGSAASNVALEITGNRITKGVPFPATQYFSSDPNTLDDYEEGSWGTGSAGLVFSTRSFSVLGYSELRDFDIISAQGGGSDSTTFDQAYNKYTKIGNLVTCSIMYKINHSRFWQTAGTPPTSIEIGSGYISTWEADAFYDDPLKISLPFPLAAGTPLNANFNLYGIGSHQTVSSIIVSAYSSTPISLVNLSYITGGAIVNAAPSGLINIGLLSSAPDNWMYLAGTFSYMTA